VGGWNIVDFGADFFVIWREYGGVQGTYGVIWSDMETMGGH
jgi:hypothetical protein